MRVRWGRWKEREGCLEDLVMRVKRERERKRKAAVGLG